MSDHTGSAYLRDVTEQLHNYKRMGEKAISQVYDSGLNRTIGPETNSIAIIVKHLHGNMRSRWTMFLTTDGEKPDRDRDSEFELPDEMTRKQLFELWEAGWTAVFDALKQVRSDDLGRTVTIRGQPHSVLQAINRQMMHYSYHVGQLVLLARHFAGANWQTLSIPKRPSQPQKGPA